MPVSTSNHDAERFGDPDHWEHVRETIFVPAVERAGYEAIRPVMAGADMIHARIIHHLQECDMVLCDLSGHNPNVFFELGVRTASNLPIALVRDESTSLPFDTSGINTASYDSSLQGWKVDAEIAKISEHLRSSEESCAGENPLWSTFGLTITATEPALDATPEDAKLDLLVREMASLRTSLADVAVGAGSQLDEPDGELQRLRADDRSAPVVLRAFLREVSTLSPDDGTELAWMWITGTDGAVFVREGQFEKLHLASQRVVREKARERRISIKVIPE